MAVQMFWLLFNKHFHYSNLKISIFLESYFFIFSSILLEVITGFLIWPVNFVSLSIKIWWTFQCDQQCYLTLRILIFIVLSLPFEATAWRKYCINGSYIWRHKDCFVCFLLQQFCNSKLTSRDVFLLCSVTSNSLAFEHLLSLAPWAPLW